MTVISSGRGFQAQAAATTAALSVPTPAPASRIFRCLGRLASMEAMNRAIGAGVKNWPNSSWRGLFSLAAASMRISSTCSRRLSELTLGARLAESLTCLHAYGVKMAHASKAEALYHASNRGLGHRIWLGEEHLQMVDFPAP